MQPDKTRRRMMLQASALLAATANPWPALGQSFPSRPVTLIVPSLPGAGTDATARAMATELGRQWGQNVIVDNVPGASGGIGAQKLLRAAPDGHTLMLANSDLVMSTIVRKNPGYALTDFAPIAHVAGAPLALVARRGLPARNMQELVELAKARPGKISVGISGAAALPALAVAMLEEAARIDLLKVPYKGASQVMTDLLGDQIDLAVTAVVNVLGASRSGTIKVLGVLSADPPAAAPELPLMSASPGLRDVTLDIWVGIFGPARMPVPVVHTINTAVQTVLRDPAYRTARAKLGENVAAPQAPEAFARYIASETARYRSSASRLPTE